MLNGVSSSILAINREIERMDNAAREIADGRNWELNLGQSSDAGPASQTELLGQSNIVRPMVDMMIAEHAFTANINSLRNRLGLQDHLIDLLA